MTMNEIMNQKGITINEEHDWNWMNHPAKDGETRWGRIRKEMQIYSPSDSIKDKLSIFIDYVIKKKCL